MKLKIDFLATAEIEISQEQYKQIEEKYCKEGDLKEWLNKYCDMSIIANGIIDCEVQDVQLDSKAIRSKLKYSNLFNLYDLATDAPIGQEKLNISHSILKELIPFVGIKLHKKELNYFYLYGDNVVVSDTRVAIKKKINEHICCNEKDGLFFHPYYLRILEDGGELIQDDEDNLLVKYKSNFYTKAEEQMSYPIKQVDAMLENYKTNNTIIKEISELSIAIQECGKLYTITIDNISIYVLKEYLDVILEQDVKYIQVERANLPIYFRSEDSNTEILLMPLKIEN